MRDNPCLGLVLFIVLMREPCAVLPVLPAVVAESPEEVLMPQGFQSPEISSHKRLDPPLKPFQAPPFMLLAEGLSLKLSFKHEADQRCLQNAFLLLSGVGDLFCLFFIIRVSLFNSPSWGL